MYPLIIRGFGAKCPGSPLYEKARSLDSPPHPSGRSLTGPRVRHQPHVVRSDLHVPDPLAQVLVLGRQYAFAGVHFDQTVLDAEHVVQPLGVLFLEVIVPDVHVAGRGSWTNGVTRVVDERRDAGRGRTVGRGSYD